MSNQQQTRPSVYTMPFIILCNGGRSIRPIMDETVGHRGMTLVLKAEIGNAGIWFSNLSLMYQVPGVKKGDPSYLLWEFWGGRSINSVNICPALRLQQDIASQNGLKGFPVDGVERAWLEDMYKIELEMLEATIDLLIARNPTIEDVILKTISSV